MGEETGATRAGAAAPIALVHGVEGDLGRGVATALHAGGARLALGGSDAAVLEALASELTGETPVLCAAGTPEEAVELVTRELGGLDLLVDDVSAATGADARERLRRTFALARAAARSLLRSSRGRLVCIAPPSTGAVQEGLAGLVRSVARELGSRGTTANLVIPGPWGEVPAEELAGVALRRAMTPDDLVGAVTFLTSEAARHITGQVLRVDGGLHMH